MIASTATPALAFGVLRAAVLKSPTEFQVACMTLPYSRFPLQRALTGIKSAGYDYVAWAHGMWRATAVKFPSWRKTRRR